MMILLIFQLLDTVGGEKFISSRLLRPRRVAGMHSA